MFKYPEDVANKYRFVTLASMRAEQLQAGAVPRIESVHRKPTVVAMEEAAAGLVPPVDPDAEFAVDGSDAPDTADE